MRAAAGESLSPRALEAEENNMADATACAGRVERLRALMAERGYDAVDPAQQPRPALAHRGGAHLRRRGRPHRLRDGATASGSTQTPATPTPSASAWAPTPPGSSTSRSSSAAAWAAERARATRSRVVAVEDTCDLAFFDAFNQAHGPALHRLPHPAHARRHLRPAHGQGCRGGRAHASRPVHHGRRVRRTYAASSSPA